MAEPLRQRRSSRLNSSTSSSSSPRHSLDSAALRRTDSASSSSQASTPQPVEAVRRRATGSAGSPSHALRVTVPPSAQARRISVAAATSGSLTSPTATPSSALIRSTRSFVSQGLPSPTMRPSDQPPLQYSPRSSSSAWTSSFPSATLPSQSSPTTPYASTSSSARRKEAPPPLSLRKKSTWGESSELPPARARQDTSGSSSLSEDDPPDSAYSLRAVPWPEVPGSGTNPAVKDNSPSKDEERDTLSSLFSFPSPRLDMAFPNSQLDMAASHAIFGSSLDFESQEKDDDDSTRMSLSASTSSLASDSSAPRHYAGLGLGFPFSMSAAADLSSLGSARVPSGASLTPGYDRELSTSRSPSTSGPESPVIDRSKLVGLGELATPRWTSGVLEKKWGTEDVPGAATARRRPQDSGANPPIPIGASPAPAQPDALSPGQLVPSASTGSLYPSLGMIDFGAANATQLSQSASASVPLHDASRYSSAYSLDAVSVEGSDDTTDLGPTHAATSPVPKSASSARRSMGAAVSLPNTAAGDWTMSPIDPLASLSRISVDDNTRRSSTGSGTSAISERRSSGGRAPVTGEAKTPRANHNRRQSASRSNFAHLPPSPAASTALQTLANGAIVPLPPPPLGISTGPTPPHSASTSANRTPDHARLSTQSFKGHHASPSIVAASILRQTRDLDHEGVDMDALAASNEGTAEALRKLDGLSSPRLSKVFSASASAPRSRTTSRETGTPPARNSAEVKTRRRTRSSGGGSISRDFDLATRAPQDPRSTAFPQSDSTTETAVPSPAPLMAATKSSTSISSAGDGRSPVSPQIARIPLHQRPSSSSIERASSPASSSPFKRGSSSSASINAGTSTTTSRDSTSGTSLSNFSVGPKDLRTSYSKNRRGSASSEASSVHSSSEPAIRPEWNELAPEGEQTYIPPVPPLPKDWESYRAAGTPGSSAQNSPRFDPGRRPSDASFPSQSSMLSPRAPEMEYGLSSSSSVQSLSTSAKTPSRKWSISFGGKSKSPKIPNIKESASFTDLLSRSQRGRESTHSSLQDSTALPKRLAASTNDIAALTSARDSDSASARTRSSVKSEAKLMSSVSERTRTSSNSSNSTTRTANAQIPGSASQAPQVIATSPGRSRSSLLSPRRTPSGIPFFSRKTSTGSATGTTPSPNPEKGEIEEKNGRKSILGLNFLRNTTSKRDKEKSPGSVLKRQTMTGAPASLPTSEKTDEFGRRASVAVSSSSMLSRRRGKTVSGSAEEHPPEAKPVILPPMQMAALSPATVKRVDSLTSSSSKISTSSTRTQGPRTTRLQESVKANLPTITGSPSTHAFPSVQERQYASEEVSPSGTPPPKSHTPTKIPRYHQRAVTVTSPRLGPRASDSSLRSGNSPTFQTKATRRLSYYGSTPDTSTLPNSVSSSALLDSSISSPATESGAIREPGLGMGEKSLASRRRLDSESGIPRTRSITTSLTAGRTPLETSTSSAASIRTSTALPRGSRRQSIIVGEEAKAVANQALASSRSSTTSLHHRASTGPATVQSTPLASSTSKRLPLKAPEASSARRSSAMSASDSLSSSRSARTLSSRVVVPTRLSKGSTPGTLTPAETDSGRSSSTSVHVSEEELRGDEEMSAYVHRQRAKKLATGASLDVIKKMFEFPDPTQPRPPLDPRSATDLYARHLCEYEREEVYDYDHVYFVGERSEKNMATKSSPTNNFGYDDDRGDYLLVPHDHICFRYEVIDVLGKGSFGQVLQCRDHKTGDMVAIKIIRNKKRFHHQALVEIKVLENLVKWDPEEKHFVIRMVDSFTFRGHLCIVTELLSINLYELVKANSFQGFTTVLIRRFTSQILGSLILLRHHRVVHCDLKPENILLKHPAKSAIKVIDFGSSCFEHEKVYTYIQSRFYRSPEVILGMNYHMAIDMWSLGCIIAEMYTGYPIFPGENEQEQLACIMEVMGVPEKYLIDRSSRKRLFFDSTGAPRIVANSKGRRRRPSTKTLAQVLKSDDDLFVDFIAKCLTWDPDRRLKPEPAMRHPWIVAGRGRAISPSTVIPPRSSRLHGAATPSGSSSNSTISSPRRKMASTGPSIGVAPNTAPVARTRTTSTTAASASTGVPRLSSKASMGLPTGSARYIAITDAESSKA